VIYVQCHISHTSHTFKLDVFVSLVWIWVENDFWGNFDVRN